MGGGGWEDISGWTTRGELLLFLINMLISPSVILSNLRNNRLL